MGALLKLSALAARPLARIACQALGLEAAHDVAEAVSTYLVDHCTDHSTKLDQALIHTLGGTVWCVQ